MVDFLETSLISSTGSSVLGEDAYSHSIDGVESPLNSSALSKKGNHLLFVDASLENYREIVESSVGMSLYDNLDVVILQPHEDGIKQVSDFLSTYENNSIDSLQILSHGSTGTVQLGEQALDSISIEMYHDDLNGWTQYLADEADIMLYGCYVAQGELGRSFIEKISSLTGADVAASDDPTGEERLGGDWRLEAEVGQIETATLQFGAEFDALLALPSGFQNEVVADGFNNPTDFAELPDGQLLVTERFGSIKIVDPAQAPFAPVQNYLTIPPIEVEASAELGLNSIVLDPDFANNGHFYVYYAAQANKSWRISRFTHNFQQNSAALNSEVVIWEKPDTFIGVGEHNGGALDFGPDGKLYLTTGDEFLPEEATDLTSANGKIIRLNPDGSIPTDNPFYDGSGPNLDEIWAVGLRNPFGMSWDQPSGRMFISEVGGNDQATAMEDLHLATLDNPGLNFGWPQYEGISGDPAISDPIFTYEHTGPTDGVNGAAIIGGTVYRGSQFPSEFDEAFFFADFVQGWIRYLKFDSAGNVIDADPSTPNKVDAFELTDQTFGPTVNVNQASDGSLYYLNIFGENFAPGGSLRRISYSSGNQAPSIQQSSADTTSGSGPLTVTFTGEANDPENDPLSYTWIFGDGNEATGAIATHTYSNSGQYSALLRVSDGENVVASNPISITVGQAPEATILSPGDASLFRAGDTITITGEAFDLNETLGPDAFAWTGRFIHNQHFHPAFSDTGTELTFTIPNTGHDYSDNTGYEITLSVTDSDGLTDTEVISIFPDKVDVTFNTNLPGNSAFTLDGLGKQGNFVHDTAINFQHNIAVPELTFVNGVAYAFDGWSNGISTASQTFTVPDTDLTLTALYSPSNVSADTLPVEEGLVLHLDANSGVSTNGDVVTGWSDLSGSGNSLSAAGDPRLVTDVLNGSSVIQLDGDGDQLSRVLSTGDLPSGNQNRSVFMVANYDGTGVGGFSYGDNQAGQTFGLAVSGQGKLMVQGWGNTLDEVTDVDGTGAGWLTQSVVLNDNIATHFKDGAAIDEFNQVYNTDLQQLILGAEIDGSPFVDMDVAKVLVYDRALSEVERQQVESYLQQKYFGTSAPVNASPIATDDSFSVVANSGATVLNVLNNDEDPEGAALTITSVEAAESGAATSITSDGSGITYVPVDGFTGADSFTYSITDGTLVATATVNINVTAASNTVELPITNGLVLHLNADAGVSTDGDLVTGWSDLSGSGNDLTAAGDPRLMTGSLNGHNTVRLDGAGDKLERVLSADDLPDNNEDRSVFVVAKYNSVGYGGFSYGKSNTNEAFGLTVSNQGDLTLQAWGNLADKVTDVDGTGAGWLTQSAVLNNNTIAHYKDGAEIDRHDHVYGTQLGQLIIGAEIDGSPFVDMEIATVLVYDRALSEAERQQVEAFLQQKYFS